MVICSCAHIISFALSFLCTDCVIKWKYNLNKIGTLSIICYIGIWVSQIPLITVLPPSYSHLILANFVSYHCFYPGPLRGLAGPGYNY